MTRRCLRPRASDSDETEGWGRGATREAWPATNDNGQATHGTRTPSAGAVVRERDGGLDYVHRCCGGDGSGGHGTRRHGAHDLHGQRVGGAVAAVLQHHGAGLVWQQLLWRTHHRRRHALESRGATASARLVSSSADVDGVTEAIDAQTPLQQIERVPRGTQRHLLEHHADFHAAAVGILVCARAHTHTMHTF